MTGVSVTLPIVAQRIRVLDGDLAVHHLPAGDADLPGAVPPDAVAVVRAPDGVVVVRPALEGDERWVALFSGGTAHGLDEPGMTASLLAPLAVQGCPVFVVATATADLVLVPRGSVPAALDSLARAGHVVDRAGGWRIG